MIKYCDLHRLLLLCFGSLLIFCQLFAKEVIDGIDVSESNDTYPLISRNVDTCPRPRDQTTSRPNTLSDDADDLQKQLENEARDRLKYGYPKTIWVFHLPRNSTVKYVQKIKRDIQVVPEEIKREKKIFHSYHYPIDDSDVPETDYNMETSTSISDLDYMTALNVKGKNKKKHKTKGVQDNISSTKTEHTFAQTLSEKNKSIFSDIDNILSNKATTKEVDKINKLGNLVERAKNISDSMPLTEGFNPDITEEPVTKNKEPGKKAKIESNKVESFKEPDLEIEFAAKKQKGQRQQGWSYKDQATWSKTFPCCAGTRQSPISIPVQVLINTKGARDFCFDNFDVMPMSLTLCTSDSRLSLTGKWEPKNWPTVYGGAAHSRRYKFHSLAAMWPSEHKIENMLYPMETQLVCVGVGYKTMGDALAAAMKDPQSVLIISTLYKFGKSYDPGAGDMLRTAMNYKSKCVSQKLKPLAHFCPPFKKYACYYGSLTIPPCTQSVLWLIRAKALNITLDTYQKLIKVSTAGAFFTRDTQQLNDRKIFFFE